MDFKTTGDDIPKKIDDKIEKISYSSTLFGTTIPRQV